MPDTDLYLKAFIFSAGASAIIVLAFGVLARTKFMGKFRLGVFRTDRFPIGSFALFSDSLGSLIALAAGIATGCRILFPQMEWSLTGALDRFLWLILPASLLIELVGCVPAVPRATLWILRLCSAMLYGRILLHGSVYLANETEGWSFLKILTLLLVTGLSLSLMWILLTRLLSGKAPATVPASISLSILSAGIAVALAGYIRGGAAAIPVGSALLSVTVTMGLLKIVNHGPASTGSPFESITGTGVVFLFSLLFMGKFFGAISTTQSVIIFFSPMLCWLTELKPFRGMSAFQAALFRLIVVSIPLFIILWLARVEFQERMGPLL